MRPQPFLSLWRNASLRATCRTARIVSRRKFGSGLPHIKDQNRATLFNETLPKSGKRKWEEWEYIMIPTCAVSAFILFVVMPMKPDTDVLSWARKEAITRNKLESEGVELKYGQFYAEGGSQTFQKEVGRAPTYNFHREIGETPIRA